MLSEISELSRLDDPEEILYECMKNHAETVQLVGSFNDCVRLVSLPIHVFVPILMALYSYHLIE
ncbi:hypothetical protein HHI36_002125, partial [Cryptolaemus montrouzieri]